MKRILLIFPVLLIAFTSLTFGQTIDKQERLNNRFQLEGNFATIFENDAGFNLNMNYTPPLPGALDGNVAVGAFWQWTFDADELEEDADIMKLGGEVRLQKAWGPFVPYIKGEAGWVRFDNSDTVDALGIGPGAGINFWLTHNIGFGAEGNTTFIVDNSDAPDDQITTFLVGTRVAF